MGKDFIQLTGNDDNAFEFNKRGGVGAIGVTANVAAKLTSDFQNACVNNINKASPLQKGFLIKAGRARKRVGCSVF